MRFLSGFCAPLFFFWALQLSLSVALPEKKDHHKDHQLPDSKDSKATAMFDHLAILGSKTAEEEFEELNPDEAKSRLKKLVKLVDTNHDEQIDEQELINWVYRSFLMLDKEEANSEMVENDENKDGFITWKEYVKKNYDLEPEDIMKYKDAASDDNKNTFMLYIDDEIKFKAADIDKNGKLGKNEYAAFAHPHDYEHMYPAEIQRTLHSFDTNKDGKISFDEFKSESDHSGIEDSKEEDISSRTKFNAYDSNNDGFLDSKEIIPWILVNNTMNAKEEADHLIESADKDNNKILSIAEILDNHDVFVSSQATNYGSILHHIKDEL